MDTAKVERVYTSYARVYDHIFGKIFHDGREHAVRLLNLSRGERVLEVGVGTGLALPFYPRTCEVVGIDLSAGMLARCRHRVWELGLAHVSLQRMDASAMEFLDDSFDAVLAAYVVTAGDRDWEAAGRSERGTYSDRSIPPFHPISISAPRDHTLHSG